MSRLERSITTAQLLQKIGAWRSPIFMVDRIEDFVPGEKGNIVVAKHVTFNEPYIEAHFPGNPVMPGVMIAEIFGQASEYLSLFGDFCRAYAQASNQDLKTSDDVCRALSTPEGEQIILRERERIAGFLAAQDLKFKKVVYPGDTIRVESALSFSDVHGFHHYKVEARVGRYVVAEGKVINFRAEREKIVARKNSSVSR